jgi:hypothetical protein
MAPSFAGRVRFPRQQRGLDAVCPHLYLTHRTFAGTFGAILKPNGATSPSDVVLGSLNVTAKLGCLDTNMFYRQCVSEFVTETPALSRLPDVPRRADPRPIPRP